MALPTYLCATERRIITKLVTKALASGYKVSVFDGEEYALKKSADKDAILSNIAATDETSLLFRTTSDDAKVGTVWLIHGNGEDVVADSSDNSAMRDLLEGVDL